MNTYEPERLPLGELDWRKFRRLLGPANAALGRYDGILNGVINPEVLLSPLMMQEAVLSSRIEGTQATLEEVLEFEASEEAQPERKADFHEVLNYRSAMRHAVDSMRKRPICLNVMLEAHEILLSGVRGRDKARRILGLYATKKTKVADLTRSQYAIRAVDALFMSPVFTSSFFIKRSGIPAATAKRILHILAEQKVLNKLRPGAGPLPTFYIFSKLIAITEGRNE